jgi:hypothetical protein
VDAPRGYRSVLSVVDGELIYRAKYQPSATEQEVQDSAPLTYRKVTRNEPEPKKR